MEILKRFATVAAIYSLAAFYGFITVIGMLFQWAKKGRVYWEQRERSLPPLCLQDAQYGRHSFIKLKSIKLHYVENGDRSKPLMLFVHGFPEFWFTWRKQLVHFSKTHWVVAVDMRGYGDSDKPSPVSAYSLEFLRGDIRDVVKALGKEKCILVGHDWGGIIAWHTAVYYPTVVDKLIILNAPHPEAFAQKLHGSVKQFLKSWYMFLFQLPYLPEKYMMASDMVILRNMFEGRIADEDLEGYKFNYGRSGSWTPPLNYYRSAFRRFDLLNPEKMPRVIQPTLIIWGEKDVALDKELPIMSAAYGDDISVQFIPDANHFVQSDNAPEVNRLIEAFVRT